MTYLPVIDWQEERRGKDKEVGEEGRGRALTRKRGADQYATVFSTSNCLNKVLQLAVAYMEILWD